MNFDKKQEDKKNKALEKALKVADDMQKKSIKVISKQKAAK